MKKTIRKISTLILAMIIAVGCFATTGIASKAANAVDVTGTIMSGSTSSMIKLNADGSEMKIKIDATTDLSGCKIMLQGTKVTCTVAVGTDKYLHASKIVSAGTTTTTTSTSGSVMISGSLKEGTTTNVIKLGTILGDFNIKFDNATDISGVRYLAVGRNVVVTCGKDNSGSLYATRIADGDNTNVTAANTNAATATVTGKITSDSNSSTVYIKNETGTMKVKIDDDTDTSKGIILATDATITAYVYTGSDSTLHATKLEQSRASVTVDTSKSYKITGKVAKGSTADVIKFDMGDGSIMNLKLDANTSCSNGIVLTTDTKITVTCARGSDAYMHAVNIEATK